MAAVAGAGFQQIRKWDDVKPFRGRIVAYQIRSPYFAPNKGFLIGNTRFGFVDEEPREWDTRETGYNLSRVMTCKDAASIRSSITSSSTFSFPR